MKEFIRILIVCSISLLAACASDSTKSLLEERAGYGVNNMPSINIHGGSGSVRYVPTRVPERVMIAWLHAKELPSKDYFWGSWLSIIVAPEGWEMTKVDVPKGDKQKLKHTQDRPTILPPKAAKSRSKT
jgi:hypothetical protein